MPLSLRTLVMSTESLIFADSLGALSAFPLISVTVSLLTLSVSSRCLSISVLRSVRIVDRSTGFVSIDERKRYDITRTIIVKITSEIKLFLSHLQLFDIGALSYIYKASMPADRATARVRPYPTLGELFIVPGRGHYLSPRQSALRSP